MQFEKQAEGKKAMSELKDKPISDLLSEGQNSVDTSAKLIVEEFVPKQLRNNVEKPACRANLYVKFLPKTIKDEKAENGERPFTDADLKILFEKFGPTTSCAIMKNEED